MQTLRTFTTPESVHTQPGEIVLRHNPDNDLHPYVTHWHNKADGGYYWGHYLPTSEKGHADFERRVLEWIDTYGTFAPGITIQSAALEGSFRDD